MYIFILFAGIIFCEEEKKRKHKNRNNKRWPTMGKLKLVSISGCFVFGSRNRSSVRAFSFLCCAENQTVEKGKRGRWEREEGERGRTPHTKPSGEEEKLKKNLVGDAKSGVRRRARVLSVHLARCVMRSNMSHKSILCLNH